MSAPALSEWGLFAALYYFTALEEVGSLEGVGGGTGDVLSYTLVRA